MPKTHASRTQILEINKLLEANLVKDTDGFVAYKAPWSDALVAETVKCSVNSVAGFRLEVFGKFRASRVGENERLTLLEASLSELVLKHNDLIKNLAVNRIIDARHLCIKGGTKPEEKA